MRVGIGESCAGGKISSEVRLELSGPRLSRREDRPWKGERCAGESWCDARRERSTEEKVLDIRFAQESGFSEDAIASRRACALGEHVQSKSSAREEISPSNSFCKCSIRFGRSRLGSLIGPSSSPRRGSGAEFAGVKLFVLPLALREAVGEEQGDASGPRKKEVTEDRKVRRGDSSMVSWMGLIRSSSDTWEEIVEIGLQDAPPKCRTKIYFHVYFQNLKDNDVMTSLHQKPILLHI